MKIAEAPSNNDCVSGAAEWVTMKISATTNAAPTNNSSQSMVGTEVSAATSLVSRAVEIAERLVNLRRSDAIVPH